ncbi:hypothetical protein J7337_001879 [Fusarium musae]|uniref:PNPLA domain-containing protein n=1 Tax=Fusarium musae TaxID=1042133 RepID=A0A9P8DU62_9HYPO|nr:hypothetical protein J7337_001879 [Fusarium musae]KAG9508315.1 hypothetical protein J7337_001879 [Fusarium musae]
MLGRLRMSVDQAINNFVDYADIVFRHPRQLHALIPGAKYSSAKAREALIKIIANSKDVVDQNSLENYPPVDIAQIEPFIVSTKNGRRARTTKDLIEYTWKDFTVPGSKTQPSDAATILEVTCATCANPNYFDAEEILGTEYCDGALLPTNPGQRAVDEIFDLHGMAPIVLVNLWTGVQSSAPITIDMGRKLRGFLQSYNPKEVDEQRDRFPEKGSNEGNLPFSHLKVQEHTLDAGGRLNEIPYDDWSTATREEITYITNMYLDRTEVKERIDSIAREAVRIRRARVRTERWRDFIAPSG